MYTVERRRLLSKLHEQVNCGEHEKSRELEIISNILLFQPVATILRLSPKEI